MGETLAINGPPRRAGAAIPSILFTAFLLCYLAVVSAPPRSFVADDADQMVLSQTLERGYHEQPPLYTWMTWFFCRLLGPTRFALGLQKVVVLALLGIALRRFAFAVLKDERKANAAALAVFLMPLFSWHALSYLTHTNIACAMGLFAISAMVGFKESPTFWRYLEYGAFLALAVLSKYNMALFAFALIAAAASVKSYRRRLLDPRFAAALGFAVLLTTPNLSWLVENREEILRLFRFKARVSGGPPSASEIGFGALRLAGNAILIAAPPSAAALIVLAPRPIRREARTASEESRLIGRFFLAASAMFLAAAVLGLTHIHERWLQPFAVVLPVFILSRFEIPLGCESRLDLLGRIGWSSAAVQLALLAAFLGGGWRYLGSYDRAVSYDEIAAEIRAKYGTTSDLTVISCDREFGANLRSLLPEASHACSAFELYTRPGLDAKRAVVVWDTRYARRPPRRAAAWVSSRFRLETLPPEDYRYVLTPGERRPGQPRRFAYVEAFRTRTR